MHVNDQTVADEPQLPLGGMKDSGRGRSGPASMHDFTEIQWITTRKAPGPPHLTKGRPSADRVNELPPR